MKCQLVMQFVMLALACLPAVSQAQNTLFAVPVLDEWGLVGMVVAMASLAGWLVNRRS